MRTFCVVLLVFSYVSCVVYGQQDQSVDPTPSSLLPSSGDVCVNVKCPSSQLMSCKDVKGPQSKKIAVMYDGVEVVCDTKTDNGGWMIIQRRTDGSVDFFRSWQSYRHGFGTLTGEFWLGLETIHKYTTQRCFELRIDLKYNNKDYWAKYSYIKVWGEKENYRLELGAFSGTAGDSLAPHKNKPFSTKDNDNDDSDDNCAQKYNGAWWYAGCLKSNLNGLWDSNQYAKGLTWQSITGYYDSVSVSEMKIRPCY